jgi:hypothetical protein
MAKKKAEAAADSGLDTVTASVCSRHLLLEREYRTAASLKFG